MQGREGVGGYFGPCVGESLEQSGFPCLRERERVGVEYDIVTFILYGEC